MTYFTRAARDAAAYFEHLPPHLLDQERPVYAANKPCCVGAHLARLFTTEPLGRSQDYLTGADAWGRLVGGNRAHAILMLRAAGAPHDPFSSDRWRIPPAIVFAQIAKMETLPRTAGACLYGARLCDAPLEGADFRGTNLYGADLRRSKLTGAKLAGADLRAVDFTNADLHRADLHRADLRGVDLTGAKLTETVFTGANVTGGTISLNALPVVNLDGAKLTLPDGNVVTLAIRSVAKQHPVRKGDRDTFTIAPDDERWRTMWPQPLPVTSGAKPPAGSAAMLTPPLD